MNMITNLKNMLESGQDNLLLRFGLGQAYLKENQPQLAIEHLQKALQYDPEYSAAWKLLGKALAESGQHEEAITTYDKGIAIAEKKGDLQAAREMRVFVKRLRK
jgi:Tfp pilus assembly protein PilF